MWNWYREKQADYCNKLENVVTDSCMYGHLTYDRSKAVGKTEKFSINDTGTIEYLGKTETGPLSHTICK